MISIRLQPQLAGLHNRIYEVMLNKIHNKMVYAKPRILSRFSLYLQTELYDIYRRIPAKVWYELGSPLYDYVIEDMIDIFVDSIDVKIHKYGLTLHCIEADYEEVLAIPGADFITKSGYYIPWLKWLLLSGTAEAEIFDFSFVPKRGTGRTGGGTMQPGGYWKLTPLFAGDGPDDNYFINLLVARGVIREMTDIIQQEITRKGHYNG